MSLRRPRTSITTALVATATLAATLTAPAYAGQGHRDHQPKLEPRTHFTMAPDGSSGTREDGEGIPNVDSVKNTIRAYYGAGSDGISNKTDSPYISEMKRIAHAQWRYLARAKKAAVKHHRKPAIVFDADDTTLWTYDMEDGAMHFVFDPKLQNDEWVQKQRFPATPSMVDFVNRAKKAGFAIFGITGRSDTQEEATLGNLDKVGYTPFNAENFYTKWSGTNPKPAYVTCAAASCTTVEYKAGTRKHIEKDLGYDIVLNVGDQWSDLQGGYADKVLKLPNPTYNLPSPDLDGTPADRAFSPRSRFTMKPDGSSGKTEGGEGIPNIDIVKTTIRTYYKATAGIADKTDSPYIREMASITRRLTPKLVDACRTADHKGQHPVVVLDADDTTLWTYDMEDGRDEVRLRPQGPERRVGPAAEVPGHARDGGADQGRRQRRLHPGRPDRAQRRPEGRHDRQPRQGGIHRLHSGELLHQVGQRDRPERPAVVGRHPVCRTASARRSSTSR